MRGHVEFAGAGRRCCAFPFPTGCCCCKERVAASGCAGGVSFGAVSVCAGLSSVLSYWLRGSIVMVDDEESTRLNLAWPDVSVKPAERALGL